MAPDDYFEIHWHKMLLYKIIIYNEKYKILFCETQEKSSQVIIPSLEEIQFFAPRYF